MPKVNPSKYGKYLVTFSGALILVVLFELFSFSTSGDKSDTAYMKDFHKSYKIFGIPIPKNLNFAHEKVPLYEFDVRESLDHELLVNTYWQSQTLLLHKRAHRWFPIIEPILKKNGIPDDFKYLALAESGFSDKVSPAGAAGFWQLLPSTAKVYGLIVNDEVDERYNVEKATEAACKYLNDAYQELGNWTLVAASYNMGISGVETQMKRQKADNYYDLLLNTETARYIFRILALKEIISHPGKYGFILRKKDLYPVIPTYTIKIDTGITNMADFAIQEGINYKILKILNPWLRTDHLTDKDSTSYIIKLPKKGYNQLMLNYYNGNDNIIAAKDSSSAPAPMTKSFPNKDTANAVIYRVTGGETIQSLADKFHVTSSQIEIWNTLPENAVLKKGQEIVIFSHLKGVKK